GLVINMASEKATQINTQFTPVLTYDQVKQVLKHFSKSDNYKYHDIFL
ncbi:5967_t:CDS:1, partial [Racocetra persica]